MGLTIEQLALEPIAEDAVRALLATFPDAGISFTSGRRRYWEQARAMAVNQLKEAQFLTATYNNGHKLADWIGTECPAGWEQDQAHIEGILLGAMLADRTLIESDHLKGLAADLQPMEDATGILTPEGRLVEEWIRAYPKTRYWTRREGGLVRWHWSLQP